MIRPEFFDRKDLTAAQRCFLDFVKVFAFTLESASVAFEQNDPGGVLQVASRTRVIDELVQAAVPRFQSRGGNDSACFFEAVLLAVRAAGVMRRLCTAGAKNFDGLDESRVFLGSLCHCAFDRLDWSHRRQLLGTRHEGAQEQDLELTLSELPASMAVERRLEHVQALIDFHDALLCARDLFQILRDVELLSEKLFPMRDAKYWQRG